MIIYKELTEGGYTYSIEHEGKKYGGLFDHEYFVEGTEQKIIDMCYRTLFKLIHHKKPLY